MKIYKELIFTTFMLLLFMLTSFLNDPLKMYLVGLIFIVMVLVNIYKYVYKKEKILYNDILIVFLISIVTFLSLNFYTATILIIIHNFMKTILKALNHKLLDFMYNYVKDDKMIKTLVNDKIIEKNFSSLEKGDVVYYQQGEFSDVSGTYLDDTYNVGDMISEDAYIKTDKSYKELMADKTLILYRKAMRKYEDKLFYPSSKVLFLLLIVIALAIYFILYFANGPSDALYYSLNILILIMPLVYIYSYTFPLFFHLSYLYKERIHLRDIKTFLDLDKVDMIVLDKSTVLTSDDLYIVSVNSEDKNTDLVALAKSLERNINDEIGRFLRTYEEDYVLDIDKSRSYVGGIKSYSGKDVYYLGNEEFFRNEDLDFKKAKDVGTVIYLAKNDKFLGSIVIRSKINDDIEEIVEYLKKKNKEIVILSGDNEEYVKYLANRLGIDRYSSFVSKKDKESFLRIAKKEGHNVLFIGDYRFDDKLLKEAFIGVVISKNEDERNSDIVINEKDFMDILRLFKTRFSFKVSFIINLVITLLFLAFRIFLLMIKGLNLEISILLMLLNLIIIIIISLDIMYKK